MGVSGVEGVLRRSCEETMAVLRHHREVLITLLQVLLYDPLVSWAMTPARAYSLQKGEVPGSSERGEGTFHLLDYPATVWQFDLIGLLAFYRLCRNEQTGRKSASAIGSETARDGRGFGIKCRWTGRKVNSSSS